MYACSFTHATYHAAVCHGVFPPFASMMQQTRECADKIAPSSLLSHVLHACTYRQTGQNTITSNKLKDIICMFHCCIANCFGITLAFASTALRLIACSLFTHQVAHNPDQAPQHEGLVLVLADQVAGRGQCEHRAARFLVVVVFVVVHFQLI